MVYPYPNYKVEASLPGLSALPNNCESFVRRMHNDQRAQVDPEAERKDLVEIMIRTQKEDIAP